MDMRRFQILQSAATNSANGPWAKIAYQEYINGLLDGILFKEEEVFCLPAHMKKGSMDDVFRHLTIEVEASIRLAQPSDLVAMLLMTHLRTKFPC